MNDQVKIEEKKEKRKYYLRSRALLGEPQTPNMVHLLIKTKMAKDEKQAGMILIWGAIFMILLAIGLTIYTYKPIKMNYSSNSVEENIIPSEIDL